MKDSLIDKPTHTDVLLGRGVGTNRRAGNTYFREIVSQHVQEYFVSTKTQKMEISRRIIDHIHSLNPPGRFLEKDAATNKWREADTKRAHEKTAQALRDGTAKLRAERKAAGEIAIEQLSRPAKKQRREDSVDADVCLSLVESAKINLPMTKEEEEEMLDMDELIYELYSPIFSSAYSTDGDSTPPPCPISPCPSANASPSPGQLGHKDSFDSTFGGLPFHIVDCNCKEKEQFDDASVVGLDDDMVDMRDEDIFHLWMTC